MNELKNDEYIVTVKRNEEDVLSLKSNDLIDLSRDMANLPVKFIDTLSNETEKIGFIFGFTFCLHQTHRKLKEIVMNLKSLEKPSCGN